MKLKNVRDDANFSVIFALAHPAAIVKGSLPTKTPLGHSPSSKKALGHFLRVPLDHALLLSQKNESYSKLLKKVELEFSRVYLHGGNG